MILTHVHAAVIALASVQLVTCSIEYCLPSQSCWPSDAEIDAFKRDMNGTGLARVLTKDDPDWPKEGLTFNLAVTKVPGLVVFVGNVDTIRRALKFAKKNNMRVSIVSSGHSFPGRNTAEGSMQISVHYMKKIVVDLKCTESDLGCITTQSGVQWGEAYREANKYNRIVVGGSNPTVSVTGWTLGGGHSPLSRMFGMGVDNVVRFHIITSDLREVWVSAVGTKTVQEDGSLITSNDTSLFWALRGGGSAFGVVVDITFKLHEDKPILQWACQYPAYQDGTSKTFEVMFKSLGPLIASAPNTFSGYIVPQIGCDPKSGACGGISKVSILHFGQARDANDAAWIKKFTDLAHEFTAAGLSGGGCFVKTYESFYKYEITAVSNVTYTTQYMGGSLIQQDRLSDSLIDTLLRHFDSAYKKSLTDPGHYLLSTAIWVGGAVRNVSVNEAAVHPGWRNAVFSFSAVTIWDHNDVNRPTVDQVQGVRDLHADLSRFSNGKYYNEAEPDLSPAQWKREFWGDQIYNQLFAIKKLWDPENMFTCIECVGSDWDPATNGVVG